MQVYVKGTKKAVNAALALGEDIEAVEYKLFDTRCLTVRQLDDRSVIKFWLRRDPVGTPIAKSYGTWNAKKGKVE